MLDFLGGLIGAGSKLIGGILGSNSAEKQNAQNIAMQKEFAQNGISWKVADAQKAGIHPLAALGAPLVGFQPQQVGDPLSSAIGDMGQDISRAVQATSSEQQRNKAVSAKLLDLQVERAELENAKLASDIAKTRMVGPPMPVSAIQDFIDGQGDSNPRARFDQPLSPAADKNLIDKVGKILAVPGHEASLARGAGMPVVAQGEELPEKKKRLQFGVSWAQHPYWSTAQEIEDAYGDAASWGYGLPKFMADIYWNVKSMRAAFDRRAAHYPSRYPKAWDWIKKKPSLLK